MVFIENRNITNLFQLLYSIQLYLFFSSALYFRKRKSKAL